AGKKTVVVDADMRRGTLHHRVPGRQRDPGLSQLLSGEARLDDVLRPLDDAGNCHVMTSGKVPPNPSELLMRDSFRELLDELRTTYDFVLVDAPPILAVTDAAVIASSTLGIITFMVARAGMHPRAELEEAAKRLTRNDNKIAGVVVNGLRKEHAE